MATDDMYRQRVKAYDYAALLVLWEEININDATDGWESGKALEYLVIRAFELSGSEVTYPYQVKFSKQVIEQIDGVVYHKGLACLVECKEYQQDAVNFEPIAKLRNQLMRRPAATVASIFSLSGFTEPALTLSNFVSPQTILLWEKDEIEYGLKNKNMSHCLWIKYKYCIEHGISNFNVISQSI
ncbi:MAG: hypothetical protein MUD08_02330 [Cytophagales bacterium]|jgi:hypothetical protein|nr:hypothetical protein [Cytophagales bacterium]